MAGKGKTDNGTVFLNGQTGKFGPFYTGTFGDVDVTMSIAKSGDLQVKAGDTSEFLKPKENDYGSYYVGDVAGKRYFISERENSRGKYMMAKLAPEREVGADGAPADRPKTYGARK